MPVIEIGMVFDGKLTELNGFVIQVKDKSIYVLIEIIQVPEK